MALARCKACGPPQGLKSNYAHVHAVASGVNFRVFCGAPTCVHPAFIWFTAKEEQEYLSGERRFRVSNHAQDVLVA
jgi:hypothetical protein